MTQPSFSSETFTPEALFAGDFPIVTKEVTIASGQNLTKNSVLGKITASGKYILSLQAAVDGSEVADVILVDDTDASGGDKVASVYLTGDFREDKLVFGTGHSAATVEADLRLRSIFLHKPVN